MKCNDDGNVCQGKAYPNKPVPIPVNIQNVIFNNVTIVNYHGEENQLLEFEEDAGFIDVFENEYLNKLLLNSLNGTHYDIAKLLYEFYKNDFRCISMDCKNNWYEFVKNRWVVGSTKLRQNISEELVKYYISAKKKYNLNSNYVKDAYKKDSMIINLIKKLKTTSFKNNIMSECCEIFYANNNNFIAKLDENNSLIGFENGVFDLKEFVFREGKHSDYVSISTGYDYVETSSENKEEVIKFINSILPNQEEREYLLKYLASCLHGENPEELFHIFTGKTRNGKSKLRDLIKFTFGAYYSSISRVPTYTTIINIDTPYYLD